MHDDSIALHTAAMLFDTRTHHTHHRPGKMGCWAPSLLGPPRCLLLSFFFLLLPDRRYLCRTHNSQILAPSRATSQPSTALTTKANDCSCSRLFSNTHTHIASKYLPSERCSGGESGSSRWGGALALARVALVFGTRNRASPMCAKHIQATASAAGATAPVAGSTQSRTHGHARTRSIHHPVCCQKDNANAVVSQRK